MQLDFSNLSYDAREYEYEFDGQKCTMKIRPYPASLQNTVISKDGLVLQGDDQFEIFNYCLVSFSGITDANGKAIPCNKEIKKKIFDFNLSGIPAFVLGKSRVFEEEKAEAEENL